MRFRTLVAMAALAIALPTSAQDGPALLAKHGCTDCHALQGSSMVPGWTQIAAKFEGKSDAIADIIAAIKQGEHGNPMSMPPTPSIPRADAKVIADYIVGLAKK
jgi:cytochrome c551/c552